MKPDDKWIPYKDVHLLITCETFDEAKRRETKYTSTMCPTSEIESEDEGELRQKRRSRPNPQYEHSDADDQSSGDVKRRRFAKPPEVGFPETPKSSKTRAVRSPDQEMNDSLNGSFGYLHNLLSPVPNNNITPRSTPAHYKTPPSQLARKEMVTGTYGNYLQSPPEQVHDVDN
ncbi:hypothetical protein JOQ06_002197 [Pogonophryne albipinna]|uniref:Uncharacterized protein n=1 Tax=Pogonophryne albipinna TaxID=1090488 RepID=A0AAD6FKK1_9TELE|nr:hypothetical protein JOQ06_002197 [Pogonophryne albipinna]